MRRLFNVDDLSAAPPAEPLRGLNPKARFNLARADGAVLCSWCDTWIPDAEIPSDSSQPVHKYCPTCSTYDNS